MVVDKVGVYGGLRLWLQEVCKLKACGLAQFSPRCGPWTLLCKAIHRRSADNNFLGLAEYVSIAKANREMDVTALLMLIASVIGCEVLFEQSQLSCMPKAAPMKTVLQHISAERQSIMHAAYGANTKKHMAFYSTASTITMHIKRKAAKDKNYDSLVTRSGRKFTGRGGSLRKSENYSALLGREVAKLFDMHHARSSTCR